MDKLSEREHYCPAGLVICAEDMKVDFNFLVSLFSLATALRVECSGKGVLVFEESSEFDLESRSKLRSTVRYNFIVWSETRENFREKYVSHPFSINSFLARGKNYPLRKSVVDNYYDGVKAVGKEKISDEVSGTMSEWSGRDGSRDRKEGRR
jgi:hypothetical protein